MADRRRVLQAGAIVALAALGGAGCDRSDAPMPEPEETGPDEQQADELALIAAYDDALANAGPAARREYLRIRSEHVAHLLALGWEQPVPSPSPETTAPAVSGARRRLARAERFAARSRREAAVIAGDAEQAQILALIAASEAQHVDALEKL
jgi:hypothetical protein